MNVGTMSFLDDTKQVINNERADRIANDDNQNIKEIAEIPFATKRIIEHVGNAVLRSGYHEGRYAKDEANRLDKPVIRFLPDVDR